MRNTHGVQKFIGALDNIARHPRQLRDMDPVRTVRSPWHDPMKKRDLIARLTHNNMKIDNPTRQTTFKLRQLMVMRRKQRTPPPPLAPARFSLSSVRSSVL